MNDVVIAGGGLAGLVSALELARKGFAVTLIEKKTYPFHKVCGEYVSNEVRPYLESLGVNLRALGALSIERFRFTSPSGRMLETRLDLGGFGISRYTLDYELYRLGEAAGVRFVLGKQVEGITYDSDAFKVSLSDGETVAAKLVIGAFGKRSRLDRQMERAFMQQPSPYVGVKYHIRQGATHRGFPTDMIALHNFQDGYCGMSAIEDGKYCFCYLTTRENVRRYGNIPDMERALMFRNPYLKAVFEEFEFVFDKPEVINEISFAPKRAVENHILMAGDSAGLITPLCGNGMAMAIHGAKLVSDLAAGYLRNRLNRSELETRYQQAWRQQFASRLWVGRTVQKFFGDPWLSEVAVTAFSFKPLLHTVMRQTHGETVQISIE